MHKLDPKGKATLVVSGGDDGNLAFLVHTSPPEAFPALGAAPVAVERVPPVIVTRAHASAVTAVAILSHPSRVRERFFLLTSGNDQWIRLWEVRVHLSPQEEEGDMIAGDPLSIQRVAKIKTNVADVSSMAVLDVIEQDERGQAGAARVLICGVGMEVVRVEYGTRSR
jgi:hypothetical protein